MGMRLPGVIFKAFARILPIDTFDVRGVRIKAVLPLHQIGTYYATRNWAVREPEALDWLDELDGDAVLFDVGANLGTESLYVALKPNGPGSILAFDVEYLGSFNLAMNLLVNRLEGRVENYFVAIGDRVGYERVEENTNYLRVPGRPKYDQAHKWVAVTTIDEFCRIRGIVPTHVKIDVDRQEANVIRGMSRVLASARLNSILVEINSASAGAEIRDTLELAGFEERPHYRQNAFNVIFRRVI
jgi:FkbM family methyltransferase